MTERATHLAEVDGFSFKVYRPTDGQSAILAQQVRLISKRNPDPSAAVSATAILVTILDKLIVDEADLEYLRDGIIDARYDFKEVVEAILAVPETVDGEVSGAAPATVTRRPRRIAR